LAVVSKRATTIHRLEGSDSIERQGWPAVLGNLRRSLSRSAPTDSIVRKLFALIARCHQMLGDLPAALNACSEGLRMDPDDAELHFRKAGQPAETEACWRRILTLKRPDQLCSVDQGICGHLTLRNLAVLADERGDRAEAGRLWRMVLDACPGDPEAMSRGEASRCTEELPANRRPRLRMERPCFPGRPALTNRLETANVYPGCRPISGSRPGIPGLQAGKERFFP